MATSKVLQFDALVLGTGIGGLQTALDLADQGFRVAVVERSPSIGGNMIRLSKVFPTLDCASCITTPKMSAAAHHENITLFTYCELNTVERENGRLVASVTQKSRFVDAAKCIGYGLCEDVCMVMKPDPEQGGFAMSKAISIPSSTALPQIPFIDPEYCLLDGKCEGKCEEICPTDAIDHFQKPENFVIEARSMVLAIVPTWSPGKTCDVSAAADGFIKTVSPKLAPSLTDMDGMFVAGVAAGPKDIVDTIIEAGSAAMEVTNYLATPSQTDRGRFHSVLAAAE